MEEIYHFLQQILTYYFTKNITVVAAHHHSGKLICLCKDRPTDLSVTKINILVVMYREGARSKKELCSSRGNCLKVGSQPQRSLARAAKPAPSAVPSKV